MMCKEARGTHFLCGKTVCQACYDVLAGTPQGAKAIAKRTTQAAERAEIARTEAAKKAALTESERKAEDDRETAKILAQNARQGKYVPYDDPSRIRRAD